MRDLSVLIPSRNEMFLKRTIDSVLENIGADTEVIAVLDGAWAEPVIPDHPRLTLVHHSVSIGQRAATNEAARISQAKYVMKLDAHCSVDKHFDVKMMADCEPDMTMVPRLYNLHAFDWKCNACGNRTYQGPTPTVCTVCKESRGFERVMEWKPRLNRKSDFMRFDKDLHFQYWRAFGKRPEAQPDIAPLMSSLGACWMMERKRYWELEGTDEATGSWGQMGTEVACKSWLSGGRQMVTKKTWYSHMFRTQGGDFGFPYEISGTAQEKARKYSQWMWRGNNWKKAIHPLSWLVEKFWPIEGWDQSNLDALKAMEA
jgi:glycosyltransferase involved in cell wall biosynthesis